jgi:hypothetical protein
MGPQVPYGPYDAMNPDDEVNMLKAEAEALQNELASINRRIRGLEKDPSE